MTQRETAFVQLWQAHRARLRGYVRGYVFNAEDIDEVLQETSIVLWKKFDEFTPGSSFLSWAIAAARFEILHFQRKKESQQGMFSERAVEALSTYAVAHTTQHEYMDFWETLGKCVGEMTDRQRDLFHRRFVTNTSPSDIARQLERPPSTIYSALQKLQRLLAECLSLHLGKE